MNEVDTNPAKDVRKNIMAELQNAIISKHSFKEKSDEVEENQPDSDPDEEQDEQNEQEDEKEEVTNVKDFNEPSQNEVSDSTERDENASESPKDSPQDSPTQIYQFLNSCVDISIGIFDRQISYKKAIPKELGVLKLTIYRKKSGFGNFSPKYFLFDEFKRVFLLNAKKKVANKTSNYLISLEDNNFSKDIDWFIGKVRSNHNKSKYLIYDNGENVDKNKYATQNQARCELGYVAYTQGKNKVKGMRTIEYIIPDLDEHQNPIKFQPIENSDSISQKWVSDNNTGMIQFITQTPYWNEEKQKFMMAFSDRVKEASVKNFQLKYKSKEESNESDEILLEFGRIDKDNFALTVKHPFSILNAFGLVLSTFDL